MTFLFSQLFRRPAQAAPARRPRLRRRPTASFKPCFETLEERAVPTSGLSDVLYVGDGGDNTVKAFDAKTGASLGTFVSSGSGGLDGPRGMVFGPHHDLLLANQNVGLPINGAIAKYDGDSGAFLGDLVPASDPKAPFAPRGVVRGPHHLLIVADMGDLGTPGGAPGRVAEYDDRTGKFVRDLIPTGFTGEFNPRAVVIGPDGDLYVSVRNLAPTGGHILKFDPVSGDFDGTFVDSTPANDLNRPEGLVFGPDENLYITSFRTDAADTDKVLEFNGETGAYLGKIDLDQVGQDRAFAQALLFGPEGRLFVPITGTGPDTGAVRRYDVGTGTFDVFVPPNAAGGLLQQPWYLTFGHTDPRTLAYHTGSSAADSSAGSSAALNEVVAALAQPLSTPMASTVAPTLPGGWARSAAPSGSTDLWVAATTSSVEPAVSAPRTGAADRLFAAWGDDLFVDALVL